MHTLYLSHSGMTEPLGQTQVLPYLRGLASRGVHIDLLACEPRRHRPGRTSTAVQLELPRSGICYTRSRRRPSHGMRRQAAAMRRPALLSPAARAVATGRPRIVHARGHLPTAVADALAGCLPGARFIFDCRGLLAEEYAATSATGTRRPALPADQWAERPPVSPRRPRRRAHRGPARGAVRRRRAARRHRDQVVGRPLLRGHRTLPARSAAPRTKRAPRWACRTSPLLVFAGSLAALRPRRHAGSVPAAPPRRRPPAPADPGRSGPALRASPSAGCGAASARRRRAAPPRSRAGWPRRTWRWPCCAVTAPPSPPRRPRWPSTWPRACPRLTSQDVARQRPAARAGASSCSPADPALGQRRRGPAGAAARPRRGPRRGPRHGRSVTSPCLRVGMRPLPGAVPAACMNISSR